MRRLLGTVAVLVCAGAAVLAAAPVQAHTGLTSSSPTPGEQVASGLGFATVLVALVGAGLVVRARRIRH